MKITTHVTLIAGKPGEPVSVPPGTYERADLDVGDSEIERLRERGLLSILADEVPGKKKAATKGEDGEK